MAAASRRSLFGLLLLVLAVSAANQWWVGRHKNEVGREVATLAQPGDIRMLSSEVCPSCAAARSWFITHGVAYSECTIERDSACRAEFEATRAPGTPALLVRGRVQVGFSPQRLQAALQRGS